MKPSYPFTATVSSLLLNNNGAEKILKFKHIKPFSEPIDNAINSANVESNSQVYWCQPWISYEGSKLTEFNTTLNRGF